MLGTLEATRMGIFNQATYIADGWKENDEETETEGINEPLIFHKYVEVKHMDWGFSKVVRVDRAR